MPLVDYDDDDDDKDDGDDDNDDGDDNDDRLRPLALKVEIHRSTVSTDSLHSKSIIKQQS